MPPRKANEWVDHMVLNLQDRGFRIADNSTIRASSNNFQLPLTRRLGLPREFHDMKDYLKLWQQELFKLSSLTLKSKITVTGERNKHLGPRWEIAGIQISVEPAPSFEVIDLFPGNEEARQEGYLDWAVFGLLDVVILAESAPLKNIRIILEKAEVDAVNSSRMAFRHAGRDVGRKLLQAVKDSALTPPG